MLRRCAPASEKPIWMPGLCAILRRICGRWLEIVVRHRIAVPCSSTRSRKASTGCSPPRSRPTCPNDLPITDGVRARHDLGVEEVAVPHPGSVLALVVLAEPGPVVGVAHQVVAGHLLLQVQGRRAGPELLEDHQVDAVGVHLERHREVLPAEVGAEPVDRARQGPHQVDDERDRLDVRGGEQAGAQRLATQADRGDRLGDDRVRVAGVGAGLQHPVAAAQEASGAGASRETSRTSTAACATGRRRRRACRTGAAGRTSRRSRRPARRRASAPSGPARTPVGRTSLRVARSSPIVAVRMSEWPMNAARLAPERTVLERRDVLLRGGPGLVPLHRGDDVLVAGSPPPGRTGRRRRRRRRARSRASRSRAGWWSRRVGGTPRGRDPRVPRRRSGCGCRPCPAAPTGRSASTTRGHPVSSSGSTEISATSPSRMPRCRIGRGAAGSVEPAAATDDHVERHGRDCDGQVGRRREVLGLALGH